MKTLTIKGITKKVQFSIRYSHSYVKKGEISNHVAIIDGIEYPIQCQVLGTKDTFIYKGFQFDRIEKRLIEIILNQEA